MKFLSLTILFLSLAVASDSSKHSRKKKSNKKASGNSDILLLKSIEEVQQKAAACAKAFMDTIARLPEKDIRNEKCFTDAETTDDQLIVAAGLANAAQTFLPRDSAARQKMESIYKSSVRLQSKLETFIAEQYEKKKTPSRAEAQIREIISFRVTAIRDISEAIQSSNFAKFSFEKLCELSKFLVDLSEYVGCFLDEDKKSFKKKMKVLKERKIALDLQSSTIDWENIEQVYSSYSRKLLGVLNDVDLAPKGALVKRLSRAVGLLASAVDEFAGLSPNHKDAMSRIGAIVKEESETYDLYRARERIQNHQGSEDISSLDKSSDEEISSDSRGEYEY